MSGWRVYSYLCFYYIYFFLSRYERSEPVNVTVLESTPTILNFTLSSKEVFYDQGKSDTNYPQIVPIPLFNRLPFYELIIDDYDDQDYSYANI